MRIDWAIPCRYAEVNGNLATIVGAGIDHTYAPTFPAPVRVVMAVRIVALPDEFGGDPPPTLRCVARDEEGTELANVGGALTVERPEGVRPDWLVGLHVPLLVQFLAPAEGTYTIEVSIAASTYPVPMHVVSTPPQQ